MINLSATVRYHARTNPEKTAIIYQNKSISYKEFYSRIQKTAAFLKTQGVGVGDVVAMFMKNSAAFIEISFACSYLGAVFLPMNYRLASAEAAYILHDAGAKVLIADVEFSILNNLEINTIYLDNEKQGDSSLLLSESIEMPPLAFTTEEQLVRLMYTSGTTSSPKGVMHSYSNLYWKSFDHILALNLTNQDKLLVVGPLYHVGAFDLPGIALLLVGGTLCIHREFNAEAVLASIEQYQLTCGWMAPVMLNGVLSVDQPERYNLSSFKWCIAGGERTPESRIRDFTRVFRAGRFIDGFGMTETCSGDTLMEEGFELKKIGSTGRPLAHVEISIMDENQNHLPANTLGEICVRGPKVTRGYWKAPDKTAESFYGDWLRSGDIGYLDEDGFLFLTDRAKDMIVTGAENVASGEVEKVLYQLPQVEEVAVIGVPDENWGEKIVAYVVLKPGQHLANDEMNGHCRQFLAGFKVPKELHLVDSLPRNPSGKVLKRILRSNYES